MRKARVWIVAMTIVALGVTLSACVQDRENTVPTPISTADVSAQPSPEPDATAEPTPDPTMLPGGTALANRAYFDFVNKRLLSVNKNPSDVAIVKNLVAAGFAKGDLEVTPDKTSELRRPSDSIEFSVRVGDSCLIGQFQSSKYASMVGPVLSGGRCLVGKTEPIK